MTTDLNSLRAEFLKQVRDRSLAWESVWKAGCEYFAALGATMPMYTGTDYVEHHKVDAAFIDKEFNQHGITPADLLRWRDLESCPGEDAEAIAWSHVVTRVTNGQFDNLRSKQKGQKRRR